ISLDGAMPLAPSFDTFGWFARDAETYEKVAQVVFAETADSGGERRAGLRPVRLAALDALLLGPAEAAEYARMMHSLSDALGAPEDAPALSRPLHDLYWTFRKLQAVEAWRTHGAFILADDRRLGPGVKERFEFGRDLP